MKNNSTEHFQNIFKTIGFDFSFLKCKKFLIPLFLILSYTFFYFFLDFSSQSLVAHDEGLYARRSRLLEESENWLIPPFENPHHKTLGSYWPIALSIRIFGNSELSLRLPSILASFICLIICYLIALIIANKESGFLALFSLSSMPLWIQYSRYTSPDMVFVLSILLVIFFFLKYLDTSYNSKKSFYIFLSGFFISIAFFIRSYMAIVPIIGLSPFLIFHLIQARNIFKTVFLSGILIGSLPLFFNLLYAYKLFGEIGISALFDFAKNQAIGTFDLNNFILIPINYLFLTFPIGFLFVLLLIFTKSNKSIKYPLLIYYYPFISVVLLLLMSNSYPHYFLFLLPSLSILLAVNVQSFINRYSFSNIVIKYSILLLLIFIFISFLSILLFYGDLFKYFSYKQILLINFISILLISSHLNSCRDLFGSNKINHIDLKGFLYNILIPQYVSLSLLYNFGILGSPNIKLKSFVNHFSIKSIINSKTIYLYKVDSKNETLLSYYLPSSKVIKSLEDIYKYDYFITSNLNLPVSENTKNSYESVLQVDDKLFLIKVVN